MDECEVEIKLRVRTDAPMVVLERWENLMGSHRIGDTELGRWFDITILQVQADVVKNGGYKD